MIPKAVQDEWAQIREKLPSFVSREVLNSCSDDFLKERYYAIIEEVVAGRKDSETSKAYVFQPLWSPAEAGDAEEQKLAEVASTRLWIRSFPLRCRRCQLTFSRCRRGPCARRFYSSATSPLSPWSSQLAKPRKRTGSIRLAVACDVRGWQHGATSSGLRGGIRS